jgi:hypothetical protein
MARRMVLPLALALLTTSVLADGTQALRAAGSQLRLLPMGPQRPTDRTTPIPVVVPEEPPAGGRFSAT